MGNSLRLVRRRSGATQAQRQWTGHERQAFEAGSWRVLGGPGTGKTALLVDVAGARISAGADPESILVLTHSRRAAASVRDAITTGRRDGAGATREPLVRTVHSYAFAVLRLQAAAHGNPPPRLMTGAEQDVVLREILRGEAADGAADWPAHLRTALPLAGFAAELRDLMLRANERGIGPEDLVRLGRKHSRPEWVAAGKFAIRYEQATLLRWSVGMEAPEASAPALDAAELVGAALTALATDDELLRREQARVRHLLVDDAQHLDPQAAQLVSLLARGTDSAVVAGDPDQTVFTFRGADARLLHDERYRPVVLAYNRRCGAVLAGLAGALAGRLPGRANHRGAAPVQAGGAVDVAVHATVAKEAAFVADCLRQAHVADGVAWSDMAVIVRSVPLAAPALRRALTAAGVPVAATATELPLAQQRSSSALLTVLRAVGGNEVTGADALALLSGPIGGADPLALRRLRRGLRRAELAAGGDRESVDVLRELLCVSDRGAADVAAALTDVEAQPLRRVLTVLAKARAAAGGGIEEVLWAAWQASGLERRWARASLRGGTVGAQADRDLDAVVALFDAAAAYVDRLPRATLGGFVEYVVQQQLPGSPRRASATPDAVALRSAHAAAGREWEVVAVAGVQEGLWPSLRPRGSLLGTQALLELSDGVGGEGEKLSRTAPLLAEERRLLLVACSRARRRLIVTAVESTTGDRDLVPSRFLHELAEHVSGGREPAPARRLPATSAVLAELRAAVCDAADPERRARAAAQLARLARAGVPGAHPSEWYGLAEPSSQAPLWDPADGPVPLSPSVVEQLQTCPLRWALERHGGTDGDTFAAVKGSVVHALVQALAGGVPPATVRAALDKAWTALELGDGWPSRQEYARTTAMLENFAAWLGRTRHELTQSGTEVDVDCVLDGEPAVHVRGRIDRLERDPDDRAVVVDVKTGRNPVSKDDAENHAQLATYQVVAVAAGLTGEPGGARLVYVAKSNRNDGATQRLQRPLDAEGLQRWRQTIHESAAATRGPAYLAIVNDGCRHCPVASSCPAQDQGRSVTEG